MNLSCVSDIDLIVELEESLNLRSEVTSNVEKIESIGLKVVSIFSENNDILYMVSSGE